MKTELVLVSFVESLGYSLAIIIGRPSLLDKLNCIIVVVSRASLRPIIQNGNLEVGAIHVTHSDGRINWIVVI